MKGLLPLAPAGTLSARRVVSSIDMFVFFPSSSERGTQSRLAVYLIQPERDTYAESFPRVEARFPESISMEFLYARFAWNVIATAMVSRDAVWT